MIAYWGVVFLVITLLLLGGEFFALATDRTTLSRTVWLASKRFPLLPFLVGLTIGILAAHFWWGGALICFEAP